VCDDAASYAATIDQLKVMMAMVVVVAMEED
jgi:hypothetical protein